MALHCPFRHTEDGSGNLSARLAVLGGREAGTSGDLAALLNLNSTSASIQPGQQHRFDRHKHRLSSV